MRRFHLKILYPPLARGSWLSLPVQAWSPLLIQFDFADMFANANAAATLEKAGYAPWRMS